MEAATSVSALRLSGDVTGVFGGAAVPDEGLVQEAGGVTSPVLLPGLPGVADLAAYHELAGGDQLLVFDDFVTLPGGLVAGPADVVRLSGGNYALDLSGVAAGIPAGAGIDALTVDGLGRRVVSLDVDAFAGGTAIDDADLVVVGAQPPAVLLAAEQLGIPEALDVDALHALANGHWLVSFDAPGAVGGLPVRDGDVLEVAPAGPSWETVYAGAQEHPGWTAAGVDAVWALEGFAPPPPAGQLRFTSTVYQVGEAQPFAVVEVERIGGLDGEVSVAYLTTAQTAAAGVDYADAAGLLVWPAGVGGIRSFQVPILDDATVEPTESVRLVLTAPTGGAALADPAVATLQIVDDDAVPVPGLDGAGRVLLLALLAGAGLLALRRVGGAGA